MSWRVSGIESRASWVPTCDYDVVTSPTRSQARYQPGDVDAFGVLRDLLPLSKRIIRGFLRYRCGIFLTSGLLAVGGDTQRRTKTGDAPD